MNAAYSRINAGPSQGPRRARTGTNRVHYARAGGLVTMGHVERTDKTLPLNEMMFYVRQDAVLRQRFAADLEAVCREFGLSRAEYEALRDRDVRRLHELGVHQYYVPQILRLFYGASMNANSHPALEAYKRAYPEEAARALATDDERRRRAEP
jgi:hypothetical protein